jgi:hypothetical protein
MTVGRGDEASGQYFAEEHDGCGMPAIGYF